MLEDFQYCIVAYDDWFVPELVECITATFATYADWELEVQIAADAMCAFDDINPN